MARPARSLLDGQTVVDLWGGWARADQSQAWDAHSTVCMMSVAKGVTAIAFNMAVDRGLIDIDKPVAHYWPEFAQAGKQDILVRWLLDHTRRHSRADHRRHVSGRLLRLSRPISARSKCRSRSGSRARARPIMSIIRAFC